MVSGTGTLTRETSDAAVLRVEEIADEGIVLLENQQNLLPLAPNSNINVFGWASTNPVYGGTGSGALNDAYHIVSLLEGLQNAGFKTNSELSDFYTNYRSDRPAVAMFEQDWTLPEPAADTYPDELLSSAKEFSDTALIVFSRPGAEQVDLPKDVTGLTYTENSSSYQDFPAGRHYLEPSQSEANMVELVCADFDNVVVICNSSNTMDLSFVDDYPQIKSVIWCPGTGDNGFNSLGRILNGTVNPSAKAADTFIRDFTQAPYWNNFGLNVYDNMTEFRITDSGPCVPGAMPHFVNYVEDIYVGYKYRETAAAVVEVYYNPPYTNGGIEKASANLIAFDKTDMLESGANQTLTLSFNVEDMASYDMSGNGGYVLEAGDYIIWNEDLARSFGEGIADMAEEMNVSGWYAPAMNIHRTPFGGRNFEYYSEDGLLSGRIASQAASAASARGVYPYIKHFALNDQETGRWEMLCTWTNEQAMRELYFKPFEICIKDNAPENIDTGLMSWQIILIAVDAALAVVVVLLEIAIFKAYKKKSRAAAQAQ